MTYFTSNPLEEIMTNRESDGAHAPPGSMSPEHPCYGCGNYREGFPCVDLCTKELFGWLKEIQQPHLSNSGIK